MKDVVYDERLLGKRHTARVVEGQAEVLQKELEEQMLEVFEERMKLTREGHTHDIVRGC